MHGTESSSLCKNEMDSEQIQAHCSSKDAIQILWSLERKPLQILDILLELVGNWHLKKRSHLQPYHVLQFFMCILGDLDPVPFWKVIERKNGTYSFDPLLPRNISLSRAQIAYIDSQFNPPPHEIR